MTLKENPGSLISFWIWRARLSLPTMSPRPIVLGFGEVDVERLAHGEVIARGGVVDRDLDRAARRRLRVTTVLFRRFVHHRLELPPPCVLAPVHLRDLDHRELASH